MGRLLRYLVKYWEVFVLRSWSPEEHKRGWDDAPTGILRISRRFLFDICDSFDQCTVAARKKKSWQFCFKAKEKLMYSLDITSSWMTAEERIWFSFFPEKHGETGRLCNEKREVKSHFDWTWAESRLFLLWWSVQEKEPSFDHTTPVRQCFLLHYLTWAISFHLQQRMH